MDDEEEWRGSFVPPKVSKTAETIHADLARQNYQNRKNESLFTRKKIRTKRGAFIQTSCGQRSIYNCLQPGACVMCSVLFERTSA